MRRKRTLWIIALCFLIGIWCAQLFGTDFFDTYGYLSEYQLRSFAASSLDKLDLSWNILWKRGKLFLLTALVCMTSAKRLLPVIAKIFIPFLCGFFSAVCIMNLGWYGIPFILVSLFPHSFLFAAAFVLIYRLQASYLGNGKRKNTRLFLSVLLIWTLFVAGCACETFLGTGFLQNLLKIAV